MEKFTKNVIIFVAVQLAGRLWVTCGLAPKFSTLHSTTLSVLMRYVVDAHKQETALSFSFPNSVQSFISVMMVKNLMVCHLRFCHSVAPVSIMQVTQSSSPLPISQSVGILRIELSKWQLSSHTHELGNSVKECGFFALWHRVEWYRGTMTMGRYITNHKNRGIVFLWNSISAKRLHGVTVQKSSDCINIPWIPEI